VCQGQPAPAYLARHRAQSMVGHRLVHPLQGSTEQLSPRQCEPVHVHAGRAAFFHKSRKKRYNRGPAYGPVGEDMHKIVKAQGCPLPHETKFNNVVDDVALPHVPPPTPW